MTSLERHVGFEACFNFRDLGGYPAGDGRSLRWGLLYRSDTLHRLTEADGVTFRSLGLRTVVDLRSGAEIEDHGRLAVPADGFAWHHVPMSDNLKLSLPDPSEPAPPPPAPTAPGEGYFMISQQYGESLATVFSLLSGDGALPAVFHCTSGKDRTGIVAALTLDLLGVPDEVIAADYVLTEAARDRSTAWIEENEPGFAAFLAQIPPERRTTNVDTILGFLGRVRSQHGSTEAFLTGLGVRRDRLVSFRRLILTD